MISSPAYPTKVVRMTMCCASMPPGQVLPRGRTSNLDDPCSRAYRLVDFYVAGTNRVSSTR